jgi:hypothetical protein
MAAAAQRFAGGAGRRGASSRGRRPAYPDSRSTECGTRATEIEQAVRAAIDQGRIAGTESFRASATLRIPEIGLDTEIDGEVALE